MDRIWVALITTVGAIAVAFVTASVTAGTAASKATDAQGAAHEALQAAQSAQAQSSQAASSSVGPLQSGQKLCRVLHGNTWRDGLIVPQDWTVSICVDYMKKSGGTGYQLGCIYSDGTNLAKEDGSLPSPNCGWK
jgi:hypothetical protein